MGDVQANIILNAAGGDAAAAEVRKASGALQEVTDNSSRMQDQFQHKFQHIGLMLFAGDALRASGLGRETRLVIGSLNMALTEGAAAAGLSSGGIMLIVAALAALAGIAAKVVEKHKDLVDGLEKIVEQTNKAIQPHVELAAAMEKAQGAGVALTKQQLALLAAEHLVIDDIKNNQIKTYQQLEGAIKQQIAANIAHAQTMHLVHEVVNAVTFAWKLWTIAIEEFLRPLAIMAETLLPINGMIQKISESLHQHATAAKLSAQETEALRQKNDLLKAKLQEIADAMKHIGTDSKKFYDDMAKAAEDSAKKQDEAYKKMWALRIADARKHSQDIEAQEKKMQENFTHVVGQMGNDFGHAFAGMLVEGQDFADNMEKAFTKMAEQIISEIIKMIAEWSIFTALSGFGGPVGAFGAAGLKGVGFATGGQMFADRPTLALFGEGGPEVATFSPLSGGGSAGGGGGSGDTYINVGPITVAGITNPDEVARVIGEKIVAQIRGQGQLNFVRN